MFELKPISPESVPNALSRAKQYRWLNQPWQAESICRDILEIELKNQQAIITLILAITDQFGTDRSPSEANAKELCALLESEYQQKYYRGMVLERLGHAARKRHTPRSRYIAFELYRQALAFYEDAEKLRPEDNQESVLRWNACVRTIREYRLEPAPKEENPQPFLDV
jgi:hypothetical protein